jgi:hypothetical protein
VPRTVAGVRHHGAVLASWAKRAVFKASGKRDQIAGGEQAWPSAVPIGLLFFTFRPSAGGHVYRRTSS